MGSCIPRTWHLENVGFKIEQILKSKTVWNASASAAVIAAGVVVQHGATGRGAHIAALNPRRGRDKAVVPTRRSMDLK